MDSSRPDLRSLEGDELSAVCFVRDYVELHFDGPILRLLGDVSVEIDDHVQRQGDPQFKDWLCRNIASKVTRVGCEKSNEITLEFRGSGMVRVIGSQLGEEFAHFVSFPEKRMQIWEASDR